MVDYFHPRFAHLAKVERKRIVMPSNIKLRLNRGEPALALPDEVRDAIDIDTLRLHRYPSYSEFYAKLAEVYNVPEECIVVGAGIEEHIRSLMMLLGEQPVALAPWPSCAMYDIYAKAFGVNLNRVGLVPTEQFHVPSLLWSITPVVGTGQPHVKALFLVNPGQPVELYYSLEELRKIAYWCCCNGVLLIIDEALHGFGAESGLPLIKEYDNVIVMRTFSKFWGAAAIRVGVAFGHPRLMKILHAVRSSGEISGPSMAVASTLLDCSDEMWSRSKLITNTRDCLVTAINFKYRATHGIRAHGRVGFSVLVEFPEPIMKNQVGNALDAQGILTKWNFPDPLQNCMLLSCGGYAMQEVFLQAFQHAIEGLPTNVSVRRSST